METGLSFLKVENKRLPAFENELTMISLKLKQTEEQNLVFVERYNDQIIEFWILIDRLKIRIIFFRVYPQKTYWSTKN